MTRTPFTPTQLWSALACAIAAFPAIGADIDTADGKLTVKGSIYYGTVIRADDRNPALLTATNGTAIGVAGAAVGGKNGDDGDLNYAQGDVASRALKGRVEFDYRKGDYGIVFGFSAWQDYALAYNGVPWGNVPNKYAAGMPLSDEGFGQRSRFAGAVLDNLYVQGRNTVLDAPLDWKFGQQRLAWGSVFANTGGLFSIAGGMGALTPRDVPASLRAGALPEDGAIPVPALTGRYVLSAKTTLEGFAQFNTGNGYPANAQPGCGTFFSASDFVVPGCNKVLLGPAALDGKQLAAGSYISRAPDVLPGDGGGMGLGVRHGMEGMDLGVYFARYDSRVPYYSAIKSQRAAATPFVPGDPGGLNPKYFFGYPEEIDLLGFTLGKRLSNGSVQAELTYRPNQPYQYNALDVLNAVATAASPTLLRAAANATAPGAVFTGYERHAAVQLNVGALNRFGGVLGAAQSTLAGEFTYKAAPDLPDVNKVRFRRADFAGIGPVGGTCVVGAPAMQCSTDGYVTASAYAYRVRAGLSYPQIFPGVDVAPTLSYGQDVKGWSEDGAINEGRQLASLSLKAIVRKSLVLEFAWQPTWGGTYNTLADRSTYALSAGFQF